MSAHRLDHANDCRVDPLKKTTHVPRYRRGSLRPSDMADVSIGVGPPLVTALTCQYETTCLLVRDINSSAFASADVPLRMLGTL